MEVVCTELVAVVDTSSVGKVRRAARAAATRLNFDETGSGELALLATEVSSNVLAHGGGGEVVILGLKHNADSLARILALDRGPGIADVSLALTDGFSTKGTPGEGLGALKRIASRMEIFTGRTGTIVLVELGKVSNAGETQIGGLAVPYPGEVMCGDAWAINQTSERLLVIIVDGLGHGTAAAEAAQEAIATFRTQFKYPPEEILRHVHGALVKTRGAVAAVAEIHPKEGKISYAGVGNISAVLLSPTKSQSLISHNGTLGGIVSRIQSIHSEWRPDSTLILHSDGLHTKWDLSTYAGLLSRHPAIIAGLLLRDFRRQKDDASVVVIKAA